MPARLLKMDTPSRGESGRQPIPLTDALAVLAAASHRPDASLWVAALLQGMRPAGLMRGLTWSCVNLEAATLDVSWQLQPLPYNVPRDRSSGFRVPDGYTAEQLVDGYHLVRPKTGKGRRTIPDRALDARRTQPVAARLQTERSRPGVARPVRSPDARDEIHRAAWRDLCAAAGVDAHDLYSCRRTTVTLLTEAGVQPEVIRAIVGHASAASTATYTHIQMTSIRRASAGLADTLKLSVGPVNGTGVPSATSFIRSTPAGSPSR